MTYVAVAAAVSYAYRSRCSSISAQKTQIVKNTPSLFLFKLKHCRTNGAEWALAKLTK